MFVQLTKELLGKPAGERIDVADADAVELAVAAFEREWGKLDGLVNNAGIYPRARALDMKLAEWEQVLRVNLTGTFLTARAVAARMKELGVPTAVHYPVPLHLQPVFAGLGQGVGRFPVSEAAARRVISLPMHPYLTPEQQQNVVTAVRKASTG